VAVPLHIPKQEGLVWLQETDKGEMLQTLISVVVILLKVGVMLLIAGIVTIVEGPVEGVAKI
jgi:hypothetical protein